MNKAKEKRIGFMLAGAFLIAVLIAAAGYSYWSVFNHRFLAVTDGKVYRSGAMPIEALENKVRKYGIRTVIDLRTHRDEVDAEHRAMQQLGVRHFSLPAEQAPAVATVKSFLRIMKKREHYPMLIHCKDGEGRAVLFSAIYRIEFENWSNERAQRASRLILYKSSFSLDRSKGIFLHNYVPLLKSVN